jgi:hypothetical protein
MPIQKHLLWRRKCAPYNAAFGLHKLLAAWFMMGEFPDTFGLCLGKLFRVNLGVNKFVTFAILRSGYFDTGAADKYPYHIT